MLDIVLDIDVETRKSNQSFPYVVYSNGDEIFVALCNKFMVRI